MRIIIIHHQGRSRDKGRRKQRKNTNEWDRLVHEIVRDVSSKNTYFFSVVRGGDNFAVFGIFGGGGGGGSLDDEILRSCLPPVRDGSANHLSTILHNHLACG